MPTARKHHFVSQFYLAGFTSDGTQDGEIHAFDIQQRISWKTNTKEIAVERDFNAIPTKNGVSDELEKQLATFEAQAASTFQRIRQSKVIPEGDDYATLVNFIALIGVRRPSMRKQLDEAQTEIFRTHLEIYLSSEEMWRNYCERSKKDGAKGFVDLPYNEARKMFLESDWSIRSHPSSFHPIEFEVLDKVIQLLARRDWSLLLAPNSSFFVTSDHPVNLNWTLPGKKPFWGPGYGSKHSMVVFPLSKEICLMGKFDSQTVTKEVDRSFVATINSIVMMGCIRFAYSPASSFECLKEDMSVTSSEHFFGAAP